MADPPESQSISDRPYADVVSEHLPSGYTADYSEQETNDSESPLGTNLDGADSTAESSLRLQGGDMHRDLFRLKAQERLRHQRAATFGGDIPRLDGSEPVNELTAAEQQLPGGFRRHFIQHKHRDDAAFEIPGTRNFIEFLDLYGSFAGEDLAESDDEADRTDDDDAQSRISETRPLLGRRKSSRLARHKGDAGTTKSFFTLLKAFVGTGIMFLPKAFNNGGILFSSITLLVVSAATMLAFHLLLKCRNQYGGGYGEIGKAIAGAKMRGVVLTSITLSQLGFVSSGIVFVAENLYVFLEAVTDGPVKVPTRALIAIQLILLIPLAFIRNISKLGPAALLADGFILIGLVYIYWFDIATIAENGLHPTVQLFNPKSFTLTIGASIFTFEGIGLILPIQSSMKQPQKFEWLLASVMIIITIIFTSVGALCYATFGSDTKIEIISNYPQDSKVVNAVQFLYAMAVLVGTPVQLFPALRILEGSLFAHLSGKKDALTKWKKNLFRTVLVIFCGVVSIVGASHLDRFVALIGSFACVPLVYIYPPFLHYKGVAQSRWVKAGDIVFMAIGVLAMAYTTVVTIVTSFLYT